MYVTRLLSVYRRDPSALALPPPEGPNSGILVIQDEAAETYNCFGMFKSHSVKNLPFPQNKNLKVEYSTSDHVDVDRVVFIPVINQPLSSNLYYVIQRRGKHKGEAYTNSREEDMTTCCFCNCIEDRKPVSLDTHDEYQQFEIRRRGSGGFVAKSVASDGIPPTFLRRKGWRVVTSTPDDFVLTQALGMDTSLRNRLPDFNFSLSQKISTPVAVGKWYTPFMFIKEGMNLKDQMSRSSYYEVRLEQRYEQIFSMENEFNQGNSVAFDVVVRREVAEVAGREAVVDENNVVSGVMWFRSSNQMGGQEISIGLHTAIVERIKWEEERAGWVGGSEREVRIQRVEEFGGIGRWRKFGCYVLVERFVFRRMNGSLALAYGFKHTHQIRCKWE